MKEEERGISLTHGRCDFPNFQTEGSQGQPLTSPHWWELVSCCFYSHSRSKTELPYFQLEKWVRENKKMQVQSQSTHAKISWWLTANNWLESMLPIPMLALKSHIVETWTFLNPSHCPFTPTTAVSGKRGMTLLTARPSFCHFLSLEIFQNIISSGKHEVRFDSRIHSC